MLQPKNYQNGCTKTRKQQYFCKNCNKRFLDFYSYKAYHPKLNEKIIQLTKEGLGIRSTARILKISTTTLLKKIIIIAKNIRQPNISKGKTYEVDELRFFIRNKSNAMWLVYAIDKKTKEVISFYIGKRTNKTLNAVIKTLIKAKAEKIHTDKLNNYQYLIPSKFIYKKIRNQFNCIEGKILL